MANSTGRLTWFLLGAAVGVGACVLLKDGTARKAAAVLVGKGLELKDRVAVSLERGKEAVEDFMAEAKASADCDIEL